MTSVQTNHMNDAYIDQQQVEEYSMEQFYAQRDELFALIEECEELEGEIQKKFNVEEYINGDIDY